MLEKQTKTYNNPAKLTDVFVKAKKYELKPEHRYPVGHIV